MRTNLTGLALTVGMGLIVILMGFGVLSAAGLVGFSASEALAEQRVPKGNNTATADSAAGLAMPAVSNSAIPGDAAAIVRGDALFKGNCVQCHAVDEKVVGPALTGIAKRRSMAWLVPWVQNSSKVVASGDEYAVKLFNDNGKQQMPSFALSKKEIEDIITWIGSQQGAHATSAPLVAVE